MGGIVREGTFKDRARFVEALRGLLLKLRQGALRGMAETWRREGGIDSARLSGFGALVEFTVAESSWRCTVEVPDWLPVPRDVVESKLDEHIAGLGGL